MRARWQRRVQPQLHDRARKRCGKGRCWCVRHPDGGFRRFKILTDGRGLSPADGFDADFKITVMANGMIEVKSVDDVYRLPAAIKGAEAK